MKLTLLALEALVASVVFELAPRRGQEQSYRQADERLRRAVFDVIKATSCHRRLWRNVTLSGSWKQHLDVEFRSPYMHKLWSFLQFEKKVWERDIYPKDDAILAALEATPLNDVKVVIIGQDPYPKSGRAHGLSFSVPQGVTPPKSLKNIFTEINADLACNDVPAAWKGHVPAGKGCLLPWARQGVLLLNAVLTVGAGCAGSHRGRGWEMFTDRVIQVINQEREHVVFLLWGGYAKKKRTLVDTSRHKVLTASHPSSRSASDGFFCCRHFSKANRYLDRYGIEHIKWFEVD